MGSILGPLLFLIYINDMSISLNCGLSLYADDSALMFAHNDPVVIASRLSSELSNCKRWLTDNKLSLHLGKTESMLFGSSRKLKGVDNFHVSCDGTAVVRVTTVKYLGVTLDAGLNGASHVGKMLKSCMGRLAFLYRNSALLDFKSRKTLCSALIQPYIDYCCSSWYSGLPVILKKRLDVFQRKMVRFVMNADYRFHVGNHELRQLSWLSIPDRVLYFKMNHLFRVRHNLAPKYIMVNFKSIALSHSHNTRGRDFNFHLSKDTSQSHSSFMFTAAKHWNALPDCLKSIPDYHVFKKRLREHLFSKYV